MISSCTILWLVDGAVTGQCHKGERHQSLGASSGGYEVMVIKELILPFGGAVSICKTTQEMCITYYYLGTSERS